MPIPTLPLPVTKAVGPEVEVKYPPMPVVAATPYTALPLVVLAYTPFPPALLAYTPAPVEVLSPTTP